MADASSDDKEVLVMSHKLIFQKGRYIIVNADADMVELVDTPDLGSGARAYRFESCYPHNKREVSFVYFSFIMREEGSWV